jgi:hypothetical protein
MKKVLAQVIATALLGSLSIIPATAAVKAGATCSKAGSTNNSGGKKFTCVKSGKKLVWNKGVAVTKPAVAPSPSPSNATEPVKEIVPAMPTSFEDLAKNYKGIPLAVWADVRKRMSSTNVKTEFKVSTGPATIQPAEKPIIQTLLSRASSIYSDFAQPAVTNVYYFNHEDIAWAQTQHRSLQQPKFKESDLAGNCRSDSDCGAFGSTSQGVGAMFMGVHLKNLDPIEIYGGTEVHEFTHVVQYALYSSQVSNNPNRFLPGWFMEGQASAVQVASGTKDYEDYLKARKKWFMHPSGSLTNYSESEILRFLDLQGVGKFDGATWSHVYDIGCFATETMIAIGGVASTLELIKEISTGTSFEAAFEEIYKTSWDKAKVAIADAVAAEYRDSRS